MIDYKDIRSLHIEASSHCNASCPTCPRNYHGGPTYPWFEKKYLSLADHKKFFPSEFAQKQKLILYCGNYGDPSLNPELVEICNWWLSHNPYMAIQINTNGGTRDKEFWTSLGKVFRGTYGNVTFSVDGLEDTNHIYRRNVDWEKLRTAMVAFIEAGGPAVWEFLVFEHNQHQVAEARELSIKWGFKEFHPKKAMGFPHNAAMPVLKRDGSFDYDIFPSTIETFRNQASSTKMKPSIHSRPSKDLKTNFDFENENLNLYKINEEQEKKFNSCNISCRALKDTQIYISAEGLVYPCCFIGSRHNAPNKYDFTNKQIQVHLKKIGQETHSLFSRSLIDIIQDTAFQKSFSDTWNIDTVREGKLAVCSEFCGSGITEYKEATSHRPRLGDV